MASPTNKPLSALLQRRGYDFLFSSAAISFAFLPECGLFQLPYIVNYVMNDNQKLFQFLALPRLSPLKNGDWNNCVGRLVGAGLRIIDGGLEKGLIGRSYFFAPGFCRTI